jgi:DNA-directed RNA polymerase subunit E"
LAERACKGCNRIVKGKECPLCKSRDISEHWRGLVVILDPRNSLIAKDLNIEIPGEYALRVR